MKYVTTDFLKLNERTKEVGGDNVHIGKKQCILESSYDESTLKIIL